MSHDSSFIGYAVECSGATYAETELCVVKYALDRLSLPKEPPRLRD
ncbi:hypothetical protein F441_18427 [Phytophthora nicotianae CJ01A1]|uniref:Uncharacterized protein n=1 Tax=Phytophthora nicotianae CJ01A1 TaxID=1317063 RepID=W2W399_PHYNI|nr:hypothetical protein F441_18427 [Phytophthora nicotianae CJ01A1]